MLFDQTSCPICTFKGHSELHLIEHIEDCHKDIYENESDCDTDSNENDINCNTDIYELETDYNTDISETDPTQDCVQMNTG